MVQVSVDLLALPVSLEESSENSHSLHPKFLLAGSGVCCSLPLTKPTMTTLPPGLVVGPHSGPGVDIGDLIDLVRIQPNLLFSTFHHISRKAFLKLERAHFSGSRLPLHSAQKINKNFLNKFSHCERAHF